MRQILTVLLLSLTMMLSIACRGTVVPPGKVVIILDSSGDSTIYKKGVYHAYGRDRAYFVDTKLKGYTETMAILCKDKVNLTVDVKWIGSFETTPESINVIKSKVPSVPISTGDVSGYELSLDQFYTTAMRDIIRSKARLIIRPYETESVQDNVIKVQADIKKLIVDRFTLSNYPISTTDILVSNLDFDESITQVRKEIKSAQLSDQKQAALAKAQVAQSKRNAEIEMEKGKALLVRVTAEARANEVLSASITPELIMMRQWEVMSEIAKSPNKDTIVIPFEALSSVKDQMLIRQNSKK
jgi:regulator of protease activity HflC (stomatin/prohibitin superfamily)